MGKERSQDGMDFGIRVAAVILRGDSLLLVRHQKPDRTAYWVLPGGRLEPGETVPQCAEREVLEETGLTGRFAGVLYVSEFMQEGRHTVDITTRVAAEEGAEASLGSDPEVSPGAEPTLRELRWVRLNKLKELELLPARIKSRLLHDAANGWSKNEVYLGNVRD